MLTNQRWFRYLFLLAAITLQAASGAFAQSIGGSITGLVKDESGAAVPGASVSATNLGTNVAYSATSNNAGNYTITNLPVGEYIVKSELAGFKTAATKAVAVEAQQTARIDFRMSVGAIEDTVEVTAEAAVLQTESATVGEVISGTTVQALPLNGRNTGQLALLLPGALTPSPRGFNNIGSINMNRPFVNGNREQTNNFTVDGLDANETLDNRVSYQPSPDAIAQISVETNNYSADVGNVGGAIVSSGSPAAFSSFTGTRSSTRTRGRTTGRTRPNRNESSTSTAPPSAAPFARTSSSSSPTTRARGRTLRARPRPRWRPKPGGGAISRA
jgi:hypothetical protein